MLEIIRLISGMEKDADGGQQNHALQTEIDYSEREQDYRIINMLIRPSTL